MEKNFGEVAVTGYASRQVERDCVIYSFKFEGCWKTVSDAVKECATKVDYFLEVMSKAGVNPEKFHLQKNSTGENYGFHNDEEIGPNNLPYNAIRIVELEVSLSVAFSAFIMDIIADKNIDVFFEERYYKKNIEQIRTKLITEAIANSRSKAELIAGSIGKKIIGIKRADIGDCARADFPDFDFLCCENAPGLHSKSIFSEISYPTMQESQSVDVVWLMDWLHKRIMCVK